MKKNKIFGLLGAAFIAIPLSVSCNGKDKTCLTIKDNYKTYVYTNTNTEDYEIKPISRILQELDTVKVSGVDTYKFKDIDYDECKTRSSWAAAGHLSRALKIAIIAEERNSNDFRDIAKKLTLHWVLSNYHNINWWQNELGANSTLANLGLFVFDYLGKKGQDAFNGKIRESSLKWRPSVSTHTGANVFDYIDITCRDAAINNDKEEMDIAVDRLAKEITNTNVEGFQTDGSFFQHGRQVQNVSYGKSVVRVGKTLYNLRGTDYKISDDKVKIISNYILEGLRFSTFKGYTNYNTVSREYSRPNNLDTQASGLKELAYYEGLSYFPQEYKDEIYDLVNSFNKRTNAVKEDKVQYFDKAKMIVCNIGHGKDAEGKEKDGIYISYKATEPNLTNTECVNGENQLGLNLSYGTNTCVMDHGDEYFNISPVMDYNYMPGTTSLMYEDTAHSHDGDDTILHYAQKIYADSLYEHKVSPDDGTSKYIYNDGQTKDIIYSMTRSMHHERSTYTVTCFATKKGMVLVGSDFGYSKQTGDPEDTSEYGIDTTKFHTTLDQYITNDRPSSSISNEETIKNHTDGNVKYTILNTGDSTNTISKTIQTIPYNGESWKRNNRDLKTEDSGVKNVATITLDGNTTNYGYAIEPSDVTGSNFVLLSQSNGVHAIKTDGKVYAAFYKKDASFIDGGVTYNLAAEEQQKFDDNPGKGYFKEF